MYAIHGRLKYVPGHGNTDSKLCQSNLLDWCISVHSRNTQSHMERMVGTEGEKEGEAEGEAEGEGEGGGKEKKYMDQEDK